MIDAIVVGSGPNGLAAAIVIAQTGRKVTVFEAEPNIGCDPWSNAPALPGFVHDTCSAIHPMAVASPFFKTLPLAEHGLEWIEPPLMLAHPLDDGAPAVAYRAVERTASALGEDAPAYRRIVGGVADRWPLIADAVLGPLRWPSHPFALARFGLGSLDSAANAVRGFATERARALFAGTAAHSLLPLDRRPSAAAGLVLGALAHVDGWPLPRGGAQRIADALAGPLCSLGGEIVTNARVESLDALPPARAILCDVSPHALARIAGNRLPAAFRRRLERYRYGMGAFKVDWALDGPIPWRDAECAQAGTVR